jgi:hypothetical protein
VVPEIFVVNRVHTEKILMNTPLPQNIISNIEKKAGFIKHCSKRKTLALFIPAVIICN